MSFKPYKSEVRFVMHPQDEHEFEQVILRDESVRFIDGPRWKTNRPPTSRNLSDLTGSYCIIWSHKDLPELEADYIEPCRDWYCRSEYATIQFIRCEVFGSLIISGRIAAAPIVTEKFPEDRATTLDRRYKSLRKFIRKHYTNSIVRWYNPNGPFHPAGPNRSANPSGTDIQMWVGPHAQNWLREDSLRRIRQFRTAGAYAFLDGTEIGTPDVERTRLST